MNNPPGGYCIGAARRTYQFDWLCKQQTGNIPMRKRRTTIVKTHPHEKPMSSYIFHAIHDAMSICAMIDNLFHVPKVRQLYESLGDKYVAEFSANNDDLISDFVGMTEKQRITNFNKISKKVGDSEKIVFLVLAVNRVLLAKETLELRDRYRYALVPGYGNRGTIFSISEFALEVAALTKDAYAWPHAIFCDMGLEIDDFEDED